MQERLGELKNMLKSAPVLAFLSHEKAFVVETYACSAVVGAVLLQKNDDGMLHSVWYGRTMNQTENNYSLWEIKALAVIFSLKEFRICLLSQTVFLLNTDRLALQYTFTTKDVYGRFDKMASLSGRVKPWIKT